MNIDKKAICDKVAKVNQLIKYSDGLAPPHSFEIRYGEESVKASKQAAYSGLLGVGIMIVNFMLFLSAFRKYVLVLSVLGAVSAVFSLISAFNMEKQVIASIDGDNITVRGKTYNCSDITEFKKFSMFNIRLLSGSKMILNVHKACDGCSDLIRWARLYNIPVNDDADDGTKDIQKKQTVMVVTVVLACMALAFLIFYLKRM